MKIENNLPILFRVEDYHEIEPIKEIFRHLNKNITVKEISWDDYDHEDLPEENDGYYYGLIYFMIEPSSEDIVNLSGNICKL